MATQPRRCKMPAMVKRLLMQASTAALLSAALLWAGAAQSQTAASAPTQAAPVSAETPERPLNLTLPRAASGPATTAPIKSANSAARPYGSGYEARGLGGGSLSPAGAASGVETARASAAQPAGMANRGPASFSRYGAGGGGRGRGRR